MSVRVQVVGELGECEDAGGGSYVSVSAGVE